MKDNIFLQCPTCIENRSMLKNVLSDFFPNNKIKMNCILAAYDASIIEAIKDASELDDKLRNRMKVILQSEYGLSEDNIQDAIEFWFDKYGEGVLGKKIITTCVDVEQLSKLDEKSEKEDCIHLERMIEHELFPSRIILQNRQEEKKYGISFKAEISKTNSEHNKKEISIYVEGSTTGDAVCDLSILIMVYNANNELIGFDSEMTVDAYSGDNDFLWGTIFVPRDEYVSKIEIKVIKRLSLM